MERPETSDQKTVLVTGGAGFLGGHLTRHLLDHGYAVRVFDIVAKAAHEAVLFRGDVRNRSQVEAALEGVDAVVHAAAAQPVSRSKRDLFHDVNVRGTATVLDAAHRLGVRRVVYVSSSATYGVPLECPLTERTRPNPVCEYGRSKIDAENVCRRYRARGLDVVILRPRVLLGPGRLGIYHMLFNWIADDKPVYLVGSGNRPFQALGIHDMVTACRLALERDCENQDFNLGARRFGSLRIDIRKVMEHARSSRAIVALPAAPAKMLLSALDVLDLSPLTAWHYLTVDTDFFYDCSKAWEVLGWLPAWSNADALIAGYDWYLEHREAVDRDHGATHTQSVPQRALRWVKALS